MDEEIKDPGYYKKLPLIVIGMFIAYTISMVLFAIPFTIGKPQGTLPSMSEQFSAVGVNAVFWICACIYIEPQLKIDPIEKKSLSVCTKFFFAGVGLLLITMISYANIYINKKSFLYIYIYLS